MGNIFENVFYHLEITGWTSDFVENNGNLMGRCSYYDVKGLDTDMTHLGF